MKYSSRQLVEAFQWFPNCELPEWFDSNRICQDHKGNWMLGLGAYWVFLVSGDYIVQDSGRIFRLSPADFAERYEAVK